MHEDLDDAAMDACVIGGGQRAEHYEMAVYATLVAWARVMGHDQAADLLEQNLDAEKAADEKLNDLAEGGINREAADVAHPRRERETRSRSTSIRAHSGRRERASVMDRRRRRKS